ncbi:MAG: HIT domain-containing protein [Spirochaetales bacterium]
MYDPHNIFARILRGELPSHKVYEDDHCLAILDIFPINPGHTLVIPKAPVENFADLPADLAAHVVAIGQKVAAAQKAAARAGALKCSGVNFFVNDGPDAGQEVPHAHLHVLPRFPGDGFAFKLGPNSRKAQAPEALAAWSQSLKEHLAGAGF